MRVYLDFDGVLCDSIAESFVVSYLAFHIAEEPVGIWRNSSWRKRYLLELSKEEALFRRYRPFIKSAEDFMVLQRAIAHLIPLENEEAYTAYRASALLPTDYEKFYVQREKIFSEDPAWWYSLHLPYEGIKEALLSVAEDERFIILSTKQGKYIRAILGSYGICWASERIITQDQKLQYIELQEKGAPAALIDDQREFARESLGFENITFYLAEWGYICKGWLQGLAVRSLALKDFGTLLNQLKQEGNLI